MTGAPCGFPLGAPCGLPITHVLVQVIIKLHDTIQHGIVRVASDYSTTSVEKGCGRRGGIMIGVSENILRESILYTVSLTITPHATGTDREVAIDSEVAIECICEWDILKDQR